MSSINGNNIAAAIRPFDTTDKYPVAHANEILGGHHSYSTITDMLNIPSGRRYIGMTCFVRSNQKKYILINDDGNERTTQEDWVIDSASVSDIKFDDGDSLLEKFTSIENNLKKRYIIFVLTHAFETGESLVELGVPFKGKITEIRANIPTSVDTLENQVSVAIESYNNTWNNIDTINITQDSANTAIKTISNPIILNAETKLRCNITSTSSNVEVINITVTIEKVDL